MATNENEIGLEANLKIDKFQRASKILDAMVGNLDKDLTAFEKKRQEEAKKTADVEEKSVQRRQKSLNQYVTGFRSAAILITGLIAGLVVSYKKLEEAAIAFGDAQAVAEFKAIDAAAQGFSDTITVMALEINKAAGILPFFTGILETARQAIIMASTGLVYMANLAGRLPELFKASAGGVDAFKKKLAEIDAQSRTATTSFFVSAVSAPGKTENANLAAKQEKELQKRFDAQEQYAEKFRDLQIKTGQSLLDAEKDYQDKSASAWKDYIEKAADIVANGVKERAKIQSDYQKKISDAEREYQRGIEDLNTSHGQRLVDIEADYQKRIRDIQGTYEEDAMDAIRNLDAIALLRAQERRDKDLQSARVGRDEQIAQEETDYQRSLYELQRALQDKRREAEDDRRTELEEQRRSEQEKLNEAKAAYNEQAAEAQRAFNEKISAIRSQYQQEDIEAQAHYLNQESQLRNHMLAMQAIMAQYGLVGGGAVTSPTRSPRGGGRRANGGVDVVTQPTQFTAGEAGPELAIFAPLDRALPSPIMQTINHTGDFSHSIDASITSAVAGMDGRIQAAVRRALDEVIR